MPKEPVQELRSLLKLGAPLALGEVGWMSTYIVDAIMVGHLASSALAISASSLGNSIFYAVSFAFINLLNGLETLVAQAYGRDDRRECVLLLMQSVWLILIATPVIVLTTLGVMLLLPRFGTPPQLLKSAWTYVVPLLWSSLPLLAYMSLRRFLQSCNSVLWITTSLLLASAVNWFFDWIFLFGHLGVRPMGIAGSAWSTNVVRIFMLLLVVVGAIQAFKKMNQWPTWGMVKPDWCRLRTLFRIGWPTGLETLAEFGTTTFLSVICAGLGTILLAANQVLLDLTALVYQGAIGLSYAVLVRVGQSAGRNDLTGVRRSARVSLVFGAVVMAVAGLLFSSFAPQWASLYTNSPQVVAAAVPIFKICSFALLSDTVLVMLAAALTGIGDTRTPMIASLVCNWLIGMPLAYLCTVHFHFALYGLWLGRASGAFGMALSLLILWHRKITRQHLQTERSLAITFEAAKAAHSGVQA